MISKNSPLLYPVYRRPYFNEFCGNKKIHEDPNYCYPDSLFQKYDIFEIFILDGGPFFYTCENFGGAKGIDFINNFVDGKLFGILYDGVTIDWNRVEKEQLNEKNALFEKFYWFHRLYFLLPFAHEYFLTRKTKWAEIWFLHFYSWYRHENQNNDKKEAQKNRQNNIFRWFLKKFLKPSIIQYLKSFLRIKKNISGIAWCDMQISWRLLILIHSVFLLKENKFLNEKNWNFIYKCIFEHAEKLYREAKIELKLSMGKGNHFLHKGVAILNVGILYPEIEESKKYVELGREIINFHITHEINKDGANIEGCPSYSHFIAGLHLEAMMLLKANNYFPIPNLEEKIKKEYEFLDQISTPTGLTLPINDSYHLNVETQKAIASQLIPSIDFKPQESLFSPETSFAVIRHSKYTLFVDGMDLDLWHNHHGKPNILLYYDKFPVIIDSGCCNYDRKERLNWYITPEAHNVLIVEPEKEDKNDIYELKGLAKVKLFDFVNRNDLKSISMTRDIKTKSFEYLWIRVIKMNDSNIEIQDTLNSSNNIKAAISFHFAPLSKIYIIQDGLIQITNLNWKIKINQNGSKDFHNEYRETISSSQSNKEQTAYCLRTIIKDNNFNLKTTIHFE